MGALPPLGEGQGAPTGRRLASEFWTVLVEPADQWYMVFVDNCASPGGPT